MRAFPLRYLLLACATLVASGCGSRTGLGGFGPPAAIVSSGGEAGSGGFSTGGIPNAGGDTGGFSTGGFTDTGGIPGAGGDTGGTESGGTGGVIDFFNATLDYFKSSAPGETDAFGGKVALSADGRTLAVGVYGEDSGTVGIDGDPEDDSRQSAGAVFVFFRQDDGWTQQAYIKASSTDALAFFGTAIALSASGDRLAVGASGESSGSSGIDGDPFNADAPSSGAVYVFARSSGTWTQETYLKASNTSPYDMFGAGVALSADGTTLAVGAPYEASAATGPGGDQTSESVGNAGAVYVFADSGLGWSQEAYLKASNTGEGDEFGRSVALTGDGSTLLVGAPGESSATTNPDGDQSDDSASHAGAAYVFSRSGSPWVQTAYLKASNTGASDAFGFSVACSSDGSTIAIGALYESSLSSGVNGDQSEDSLESVGAVYVHERRGLEWEQVAYVKPSNPQLAFFGSSLGLSADGTLLLVGAPGESSAAQGINGDPNAGIQFLSGAAYLFALGPYGWEQKVYIKAHNTSVDAAFGTSVAVNADGRTVAVGSPYESGSSPGINGNPHDLDTSYSGATYVYRFD